MKKVIALKGISNVGKSTSILAFYNWFKSIYSYDIIVAPNPRRKKDLFTIIQLGDLIIGIGSAGDTKEIVEWQVKEFLKHDCDIIICACRTRGGSYEKVCEYERRGYELNFINVPAISDKTRDTLAANFYFAINKGIRSWIQNLENQHILVQSEINGSSMHHLNTACRLYFPKLVCDELKNEYDPNEEKGGFILFAPEFKDGIVVLNAQRIEWIANQSDNKRNSYRIDTPEHRTVQWSALNSELFPLAFHTHPAEEGDLVMKSIGVIRQMNTSPADKKVSFRTYNTGTVKFLMPDILVVGQVTHINGVFIGIYNGLVTPLDFEKRKREVTGEMMETVTKGISDLAKTDAGKAALFGAGVLALLATIAAPRVAFGLLSGIAIATPIASISTQKENVYFGITGQHDFEILIPEVNESVLLDNQTVLRGIE